MSDELKSCPFCGVKPTMSHWNGWYVYHKCREQRGTGYGIVHVGTSHCETHKKAAKLWNRRATTTTHAVIVSDESTDCATGYCRCELCGEPIDQWDHYCRWCGAEVER